MLKHSILRTYIAIVRGERFTDSEIGATKDFTAPYSGRLIDSFPTVQLNWTENEKFREEVCAARDMSDAEFFAAMIIPKPSYVENLFYSSELRRIYGLGKLRFTSGFDKDGNFILPKGNGYLAPLYDGKFIRGFELRSYAKLRRAA